MTEDKLLDISAEENAQGKIYFANEVVATIAGLAATEVDGVAGMSGGITSGLAELLGRKNLTKGVKVEVGTEEAAVDLLMVMNYGVSIQDVAKAVQENVKKSIESMTGLRVVEVNVRVQGIYIEKEKNTDALPEETKGPRVK